MQKQSRLRQIKRARPQKKPQNIHKQLSIFKTRGVTSMIKNSITQYNNMMMSLEN